MTAPLVSVIMAVRNGERFLRQAIESVFSQDYRPIEIILIDGQSVDRTAEIARAFPDIHYIYQETLGTANAYHNGITESRGEYVAFLSHDDLWTPDKLSAQVGYLIEHPEAQCTITRVKFFLEPGCAFPATLHREILEGDRAVRIMETLVARRQAFDQVGMFDPQVSPADDVDWFARANDLGVSVAVIDRVLLLKRIHDRNTSVNAAGNMQSLFIALRRSSARKRELEIE